MITPGFSPTATERVLPKLALDFTTANLDPRVTFTRTTDATHPATYVNSSGYVASATNDQPRFDFNPVTLACKGLLIEESRQNLITYSQYFTTNWTAYQATITANSTTSPDGTVNASVLTENTGTVQPFVAITTRPNLTAASTYTYSAYVKANGRTYVLVDLYAAQNFYVSAVFDLSGVAVTKTQAGSGSTYVSSSIAAAGNGWYRITLTGVLNKLTVDPQIYLTNSTTPTIDTYGNPPAYTGDGTSGAYIWGCQLELGAFATSLIPNAGNTQNTRNADVATMTGTNFSSWFNESQGSIEIQYDIIGKTTTVKIAAQMDDGTLSNRVGVIGQEFQSPNVASGGYVITNNVAQMVLYPNTNLSTNTVYKNCVAYQVNNCSATVNTVFLTDDTVSVPSGLTTLRIGNRISDGYLNGHVQKINYWPQRITNAETQAFTA